MLRGGQALEQAPMKNCHLHLGSFQEQVLQTLGCCGFAGDDPALSRIR